MSDFKEIPLYSYEDEVLYESRGIKFYPGAGLMDLLPLLVVDGTHHETVFAGMPLNVEVRQVGPGELMYRVGIIGPYEKALFYTTKRAENDNYTLRLFQVHLDAMLRMDPDMYRRSERWSEANDFNPGSVVRIPALDHGLFMLSVDYVWEQKGNGDRKNFHAVEVTEFRAPLPGVLTKPKTPDFGAIEGDITGIAKAVAEAMTGVRKAATSFPANAHSGREAAERDFFTSMAMDALKDIQQKQAQPPAGPMQEAAEKYRLLWEQHQREELSRNQSTGFWLPGRANFTFDDGPLKQWIHVFTNSEVMYKGGTVTAEAGVDALNNPGYRFTWTSKARHGDIRKVGVFVTMQEVGNRYVKLSSIAKTFDKTAAEEDAKRYKDNDRGYH